jgi:NADH:ubiquinone oxidoreductase subunit C
MRLLNQIQLFEEIFEALERAFPDHDLQVRAVPLDDTIITLPPEHLWEAMRIITEDFNVYHLSAITGTDTGEAIVLLYHIWQLYGITLEVKLPHERPTIASLTPMIPGAAFYEREIHEMLGVHVEGHPDLTPLLMPDDWDGHHPLRKESADE